MLAAFSQDWFSIKNIWVSGIIIKAVIWYVLNLRSAFSKKRQNIQWSLSICRGFTPSVSRWGNKIYEINFKEKKLGEKKNNQGV